MAKSSLSNNGKPRKSIDEMSLAEIQAYNDELFAKLNRLLRERAERNAQPQPEAEPVKAAKLPTKRMRKAVERFDGMTDSEQVDSLKAMW